MDEFELIGRYFAPLGRSGGDVIRGIGDDAAIVQLPPGQRLVVAVDTLVEGRHFPPDIAPEALGYRAAAVNLSDLAAMAAQPRYALLALTMPTAEHAWLSAFARGFAAALSGADCVLIGGDTTRGPLTVTVQVLGTVADHALTRDAAQPGDLVLVSGTLGDARAALDVMDRVGDADADFLRARFERPTPRLALATALAPWVHAAIDVSDGLVQDLGHIAAASAVGLEIELAKLPLSESLSRTVDAAQALVYAATGGDDYELAFTVAAAQLDRVLATAASAGERVSVIGRVCEGSGVRCFGADGRQVVPAQPGYRHFD